MFSIKKNIGYLLIVISIAGYFYITSLNKDITNQDVVSLATNLTEREEKTTDTDYKLIMVNIKGCVTNPGLYQVSSNLRIGDLISIAGGLTETADISELNLAQKLADEMVIEIPEKYSGSSTHTTITEPPVTTTESPITSREEYISIYISGAVNDPNIYDLPKDSTLGAAITAAGGLKETADLNNINLTRVLYDGEKIIIPEKQTATKMIYVKLLGEVQHPDVYYVADDTDLKGLIELAGGLTENADINKINWDTELCLGAVITIPGKTEDSEYSEYDSEGKININYASAETLMELPGIGEILAQRIIDYRSENGDFLAIEDIMLVSGIKTSVFEEIKELITV